MVIFEQLPQTRHSNPSPLLGNPRSVTGSTGARVPPRRPTAATICRDRRMRARRHATLMPASRIGGTRIQATSTSQLAAAVPDGSTPRDETAHRSCNADVAHARGHCGESSKGDGLFPSARGSVNAASAPARRFSTGISRTTLVITHLPVLGGAANDHVFSTAFLTCVYAAFNVSAIWCWSSRARGSALLRYPVCSQGPRAGGAPHREGSRGLPHSRRNRSGNAAQVV